MTPVISCIIQTKLLLGETGIITYSKAKFESQKVAAIVMDQQKQHIADDGIVSGGIVYRLSKTIATIGCIRRNKKNALWFESIKRILFGKVIDAMATARELAVYRFTIIINRACI